MLPRSLCTNNFLDEFPVISGNLNIKISQESAQDTGSSCLNELLWILNIVTNKLVNTGN